MKDTYAKYNESVIVLHRIGQQPEWRKLMKRSLVLLVLAMVFIFGGIAQAGGKPGGYSGVTGVYAFQNFDAANAMQEEMDYDNAPGVGFKLGYRFQKAVAMEAEYDWFSGFDYEGYPSSGGGIIHATSSTELAALMLSVKYFPANNESKLDPYIIWGAGMMWFDRTVTVSAPLFGLPVTGSSVSDEDWCMKAGFGLDYWFTDDFSMNLEGAYVWAYGDINTINYFSLGLGANLHF